MNSTDDKLAALFREGTARRDREPAECPSPDDLAQLASGDARTRLRAQLVDHLTRCSDCSAELKLALEHRPSPTIAPSSQTVSWLDGLRAGLRPLTPQPAMVAVLLFLAIGVLSVWTSQQPDRTMRGSDVTAANVSPGHGAELDRAPARLVWPMFTGIENDASYRVILYDDESSPLWESATTTATEHSLPAEVRESLELGRTYYWRVFATIGIEKSSSDLYQFRIMT